MGKQAGPARPKEVRAEAGWGGGAGPFMPRGSLPVCGGRCGPPSSRAGGQGAAKGSRFDPDSCCPVVSHSCLHFPWLSELMQGYLCQVPASLAKASPPQRSRSEPVP